MVTSSDVPHYSDSIQSVLQDLIQQRTGHAFLDDRRDRLMEKLAPLVAAHGFESYLDYYYLLKYGEDNEREWRRVESALAINETYFWREYEAIDAAARLLVPRMQREQPGRAVRIWHAACSSGEEPYTLAISLMETGCFLHGQVEIVATDFDEDALETARQGLYPPRAFRSMPEAIRQHYFTECKDENRLRLVDPVRSLVRFSYLNLIDETDMQKMLNFDLIFCRNAFIYFSTPAIRTVVERFHRSLCTPGYLFTAAAESLLRVTTLFELTEVGGALAYKKE